MRVTRQTWDKAIWAIASLATLTITGSGAQAAPLPVAAPGVFTGDLRKLRPARALTEEVKGHEGPERRITHPEALLRVPLEQSQPDALLPLQARAERNGLLRVYSPPELNFDAQEYSSVDPPDTNGDVGSNYYVQAINHFDGTYITIYDKVTGAIAAGPFELDSLWPSGGDCADGAGDPIVLYDQFASRWLLSEFSNTGDRLCIYVSRNNNPITGGWSTYEIQAPEFPDYPKYAVWSDAYYITTNETSPAVYAIERAKMLAGLPAQVQRFEASSLSGFSFQALTPADADGSTEPPAGSKAFFLRHKDDEVNPPAVGGSDRVEVWELDIDWSVPANSTFSLASSIAVTEFESELCGTSGTECIPQAGTSQLLDPLREIVMWRAQYRNFGTHQSIVGNFVTDVGGGALDHAGIRWFELRRSGLGAWSLFQEGTYAPDASHRWMGSIAMDHAGNMAIGYSTSSPSISPGIRYTGRLASDGSGAMTQTEITSVSGSDPYSVDRWGDYSSMNVDPVNECTFWFTSEYATLGDWQTRITRLRYDAPTCTDATTPTCGNGSKEVGEDCDGGDDSSCPGLCTGSCTCPAPSCGNNSIEVGEYCDGTSLGGCSECLADCTCNLCNTAPEPSANCFLQVEPLKASLSISNVVDSTKDKLKWSWAKGEATSVEDFGNPTNSNGPNYQFCIYDSSGSSQPLQSAMIPAGGTCLGKPCWKASPTGYSYKDKGGSAGGIIKLSLKSGFSGKSSVKVQGKGTLLAPPDPALTLPVTVQLLTYDGSVTRCWQTQYTSASRNDDEQFSAKGP